MPYQFLSVEALPSLFINYASFTSKKSTSTAVSDIYAVVSSWCEMVQTITLLKSQIVFASFNDALLSNNGISQLMTSVSTRQFTEPLLARNLTFSLEYKWYDFHSRVPSALLQATMKWIKLKSIWTTHHFRTWSVDDSCIICFRHKYKLGRQDWRCWCHKYDVNRFHFSGITLVFCYVSNL